MSKRNTTIRDWWYEYLHILQKNSGAADLTLLNQLTHDLMESGDVIRGRSMPRDGAGDLASECDRLRAIRASQLSRAPSEI